MFTKNVLDKIISFYSKGEYLRDVIEAKENFIRWTGIFDVESYEAEYTLRQFEDWYLFRRALYKESIPPIRAALEEPRLKLSQQESEVCKSKSLRSLFSLQKILGNEILVQDIFSKQNIVLENSPLICGLSKLQIFEARIIFFCGEKFFNNSFCFHPPQARKYILERIKKIKKVNKKDEVSLEEEKNRFIFELFRYSHHVSHYKHLQIRQIYSNDNRVRM